MSKSPTCCECNLFEHLEIIEAFKEGRINKEDKNKLQDDLKCECKVEEPETEDELIQRAEFKVKAREEIADVFIIKALATAKVMLETKLNSFVDPYSGLSMINDEIIHALIQIEPVFIERQRAQDGPEIEKAFIEEEVERLTKEISKRV